MTMEAFILAKSYLPKNGTYTMMDHLHAMEMTVIGEFNRVAINNKKDPIKIGVKADKIVVASKKETIVIKELAKNVQIGRDK